MITVGRPRTSIVSASPPLRDRNTRAPYLSFLIASNMGEHLAREKFHTLARQLVRQGARLTAGQHHAHPEFLLVAGQLLAHGPRAADDGEDALLDVVPAL